MLRHDIRHHPVFIAFDDAGNHKEHGPQHDKELPHEHAQRHGSVVARPECIGNLAERRPAVRLLPVGGSRIPHKEPVSADLKHVENKNRQQQEHQCRYRKSVLQNAVDTGRIQLIDEIADLLCLLGCQAVLLFQLLNRNDIIILLLLLVALGCIVQI